MLVIVLLSGSASIWAYNVGYTTWHPRTSQDMPLSILAMDHWENQMNR